MQVSDYTKESLQLRQPLPKDLFTPSKEIIHTRNWYDSHAQPTSIVGSYLIKAGMTNPAKTPLAQHTLVGVNLDLPIALSCPSQLDISDIESVTTHSIHTPHALISCLQTGLYGTSAKSKPRHISYSATISCNPDI